MFQRLKHKLNTKIFDKDIYVLNLIYFQLINKYKSYI
jgi:hypothetical protein